MNENEAKKFFNEIMPDIRHIQEIARTYGVNDTNIRMTMDNYIDLNINGYEFELMHPSDDDTSSDDKYIFSHKGELKEVTGNENNAE